MILRSPSVPVLLTALLAPLAALAQDEPLILDEIVISGGLTPLSVDSYARAHSVLTGADIRSRGFVTVQDALRSVPGVSVTSTGEALTSIRIRGGEPNHVLVLIDGVAANSPGNGNYYFSGMPTENIERIEILRGPQSAIHGPNAASGVISITTSGADQPGLSYGGGVELGGQNTRAANAFVRAMGERGTLSLSLATRHSDGEDMSRTPGGDRDFNDRDVLGLNGSYHLGGGIRAGFALRRSWQEYGYDASSSMVDDPADYVIDAPLVAKNDEVYGTLWLEAEAAGGRMVNRLTISGMNQATDHFRDGVPDYDDASRRREFRLDGSWAIDSDDARNAAQKLNFAAGKQRETYRASYAPGGDYERDMTSLALEYQGRFDNGTSVQAGIRRDLNDDFKDATSWNLAAAWDLPDRDLRLRAAVGRATVNPTMFEQYGYIPGSFAGNPDLTPETSLGYEIGADLGFAGGQGQAGLTLFTSKIEDMIVGAGDSAVNLPGSSTRKGFELTAGMQVTGNLHLGADYTYNDATKEDGGILARVPRHEMHLRARADFVQGRGAVTAELRHVAGNHDEEWFRSFTPDTTKLPDFTTVNLAAHYDLTDQVRLSGRVVNLFDKDYSEAWGYYGQGRTAYVGLSARW